ncbi:NADPH oxidase organizer 1, partial [Cladochytrium tenue]
MDPNTDVKKKMDGEYHSKLKEAVLGYVQVEGGFISTLSEGSTRVQEMASSIDRDKDLEMFLVDHATTFVLSKHFTFELAGSDDVRSLEVDDMSRVALGERLFRLINQEAEMRATAEKKQKELLAVQQLASTYKETPQFGNANNPLEPIAPALANTAATITSSASSVNSSRTSLAPRPASEEPTDTYVALYDYSAMAAGELTIAEGDQLVAKEQEKGGWILVKSAKTDAEGFVPFDYLKRTTEVSSPKFSTSRLSLMPDPRRKAKEVTAVYDYKGSDATELSFHAGDRIQVTSAGDESDDAWWDGVNRRTGQKGSFPLMFTRGWARGDDGDDNDDAASSTVGRSDSRRSSVASSATGATGAAAASAAASALARAVSNSTLAARPSVSAATARDTREKGR